MRSGAAIRSACAAQFLWDGHAVTAEHATTLQREKMSEDHFDQYEHFNYDQDKQMLSGHSGKQRSKKEAELNTNRHNPGGHERKIVTKLMNAEKNNQGRGEKS